MYLEDGDKNCGTTLILAHGAGAPMDSPFMVYFAEEIAKAGFHVVRFEFPYMQERRTSGKKRPPNKQADLLAHWKKVIADFEGTNRVFIGGKSMGGRMASLIADETNVAGLVCLGYPFYAIGKPEKPRTEHLEDLQSPTLIVQGERDSMGNKDAVAQYQLSEQIHLHWLKDGDHSFKPRKASGLTEEENWAQGVKAVTEFLR